jgi:hypothetical protein
LSATVKPELRWLRHQRLYSDESFFASITLTCSNPSPVCPVTQAIAIDPAGAHPIITLIIDYTGVHLRWMIPLSIFTVVHVH